MQDFKPISFIPYDSKIPYINYVFEDKSTYTKASDKGFYDKDGDFLVDEKGAFLPNIDFVFVNTHKLKEVGLYYDEHGVYTPYIEDTPKHVEFRKREVNRRKHGYSAPCKLYHKDIKKYNELVKKGEYELASRLIHILTITGDHYNFINYGIINKLDPASVSVSVIKNDAGENEVNVSGRKMDGSPDFFASQYWWYKTKQFARKNNHHVIGGKSRRKGFSYMGAVDSANTVNLYKRLTVIHVAFDKKYLQQGNAITGMTLSQIDHYEKETPFSRGIISRDMDDIYLGYKLKDNSDNGIQSHILTVSAGPANPDCAIGKDADEIKIEELSNFPNFDAFYKVTEPTTRTGAIMTGLITAWGTGGSKEGKWAIFESNFYNPRSSKFLPMVNIWDKNSRHKECGYFCPYIESLQGFDTFGRPSIDEYGNTIYHIAETINDMERKIAKRDAKTEQDYILHCGQYSNMPSESFSSTNENIFTSPAFLSHIDKVKHNPEFKYYTDGMVVDTEDGRKFMPNTKLHELGISTHPFIENVPVKSEDDLRGCIRVFNQPYRKVIDGKLIIDPDMYRISYDTVGKDIDNPNYKHSLNSITVWMFPNLNLPFLPLRREATFQGRFPTLAEADKVALDLSNMYGGCKVGFESNRGETKSNFKHWKELNRLLKEPVEVWDEKVKPGTVLNYGINIGDKLRKYQGLRILKEILYTKLPYGDEGKFKYLFEFIHDLPYLRELLTWDVVGNFDRVSESIVMAFYYKQYTMKLEKMLTARKSLLSTNQEVTDLSGENKVTEDIFDRNWY